MKKTIAVLLFVTILLSACVPDIPETLESQIQAGYVNEIKIIGAKEGVQIFDFMSQANPNPDYGWCVAYEVDIDGETWRFERVYLHAMGISELGDWVEVSAWNSGLGIFPPGTEKGDKWCNY